MQVFFQELYSHIDKNSGKKFEDMFFVKIASKGTSLIGLKSLPLTWWLFLAGSISIFQVVQSS